MKAREVNFDGLVGLTHHYAGLSFGNEASTKHRFRVSNPKLAAKQGLLKMKALSDAGFPQAVIPPQGAQTWPCCASWGSAVRMNRWWKSRHADATPAFRSQFSLLDVGGECRHRCAVGGYAGRQSASDRC